MVLVFSNPMILLTFVTSARVRFSFTLCGGQASDRERMNTPEFKESNYTIIQLTDE